MWRPFGTGDEQADHSHVPASVRPIPQAGEVVSERRRWGVWGVGPRIVLATMAAYIVIVLLALVVPSLRISSHRPMAANVAAWILIISAVVVWFAAIRRMRAANAGGYLETTGMFAYVRNPIYSAFIFVECPGLVLAAWAWPAFVLPVVAYGFFRLWIPSEEHQLRDRYGPLYEVYVRRVPALVPRRPRDVAAGAGSAGLGGGKAAQQAAARKAAAARAASRARRGGKDRSHLRGL